MLAARHWFDMCSLSFIVLAATVGAAASDRIQPYSQNPRYWQYQEEPVLLLGGTKDDNLFQIPDLEEHLNALAACGGNYIRNTMSARDPGNAQPFKQLDNGKYDLDQWNPEYWSRLDRMLQLTADRGIFVQVELWAFHDFNRTTWPPNPWRPANNVNYDTTNTRLKDTAVNLGTDRHEFFFTVPALNDDERVLRYQNRFVERILASTLKHDHVLYCITNEIHPQFSPEWGWYWAGYIKAKAAKTGKQIEVTEMFWEPDMKAEQQKASLDRSDVYSFFECSQNSANSGQANGDSMQYVYSHLAKQSRPINHVKIYGADNGPPWAGKSIEAEKRFWRNIVGGSASSRFHRPDTGLGLSDAAQTHIRSMRMLTAELDVFRCRPDIGYRLLEDRADDEAYLIYQAGSQYAVFFPAGGSVGLNLTETDGEFHLKWLDIANSAWSASNSVSGGQVVSLRTPRPGLWLAFVHR